MTQRKARKPRASFYDLVGCYYITLDEADHVNVGDVVTRADGRVIIRGMVLVGRGEHAKYRVDTLPYTPANQRAVASLEGEI